MMRRAISCLLSVATLLLAICNVTQALSVSWHSQPFSAPALSDASAWDRKNTFNRWLTDKGIDMSAIEIAISTRPQREFMVIRTEKDVPARNFLFTFPESTVITERSIRQSSPQATENLSSNDVMVLWLMREVQNSNSPWKPYLDMFPREFTSALWWDSDTLALVRGMAAYRAKEIRASLKEGFKYLFEEYKVQDKFPGFIPPEAVSWEAYRWAHSVVQAHTRALETRQAVGDGVSNMAFVPIVDLCTHNSRVNTTDLLFKPGQDVRIALQPVPKPKREVQINHGAFSETEALLQFGFVTALKTTGKSGAKMLPYKYDSVALRLEFDEEQQSLLNENEILEPGNLVLDKNTMPAKLLAVVYTLEHGELPRAPNDHKEIEGEYLKISGVSAADAPPPSSLVGQGIDEQRTTLLRVHEMLNEVLEQYESIDSDREMKRISSLVEDELEHHIIAIKYVNAREKKIIQSVIKQISRRLDFLEKVESGTGKEDL